MGRTASCGNKQKVCIAIAILKQLEIPFFALFDADAEAANPGEAEKNRSLLGLCDEDPEGLAGARSQIRELRGQA